MHSGNVDHTHKQQCKAMTGPGGIKCPCCTKYNNPKRNKQYINRTQRRKAKVALRERFDG